MTRWPGRTLRLGYSGADVAAYTRCLTRWNPHVRPGPMPQHEAYFGPAMQIQVKRFQRAHTINHPKDPIPASGWLGPHTHAALVNWADALAISLLDQAFQRYRPPTPLDHLADLAEWCYLNRYGIHYTQSAARWYDFGGLCAHRLPKSRDCSSWATEVYRCAGLPDPNSLGFTAGYTGTMTNHGRIVSVYGAPVGALVFYGGWSIPEHVAISAGHGMVWSHGSEAGPLFLPVSYRRDATHARVYT